MEYLNKILLQIYYRVHQWQKFENRLIFGEVMGKSLASCFWTHSVGQLSLGSLSRVPAWLGERRECQLCHVWSHVAREFPHGVVRLPNNSLTDRELLYPYTLLCFFSNWSIPGRVLLQAYYFAGLFLLHIQKYDKAREYVDRACKLSPHAKDVSHSLTAWCKISFCRNFVTVTKFFMCIWW